MSYLSDAPAPNVTTPGLCGIAPEILGETSNVVEGVFLLWENGSTISYSFFGGTENQQAAVDAVAPEWTRYANLTLQREDDYDEGAMIRIGFESNLGTWSAVGKAALTIASNKPTMNLSWIQDSPQISELDRGTILHEWGHALGLQHEHRTARGSVKLIPNEAHSYYLQTQGLQKDQVDQILSAYGSKDVSNYHQVYEDSIMAYFVPSKFNAENVHVKINTRLSDMDKAFMVINYTRNVPYPKTKEWTFDKALAVAGIPPRLREDMLATRTQDNQAVRQLYAHWIRECQVKNRTTPLSGDLLSPPAVRQTLSNVVDAALVQRGLDPQLSALYFDIQQGIWSQLVNIIESPSFKEVVLTIVDSAISRYGIKPLGERNPSAPGPYPLIQGLPSGAEPKEQGSSNGGSSKSEESSKAEGSSKSGKLLTEADLIASADNPYGPPDPSMICIYPGKESSKAEESPKIEGSSRSGKLLTEADLIASADNPYGPPDASMICIYPGKPGPEDDE